MMEDSEVINENEDGHSIPKASAPSFRSIVVIYVAVFIDVFGFGIIFPLLPYYAISLGASAAQIGLLGTSYSIFAFFGTFMWGALSDKYGRKYFILLGLFGVGMGQVVFGIAKSLPFLILARSIAGLSGGTEAVAGAYIADLTPPEQRTKYLGQLGMMGGLGMVLGPAFGGMLGSLIGFSWTAWVAASFSLITCVIGIFTLQEPRNKTFKRAGLNPREMVLLATGRKYVLLFISACFCSFGWIGAEVTFPILAAKRFELTSMFLGLILCGFGLIYCITLFFAGKFAEKFGEKICVIAGCIGSALVIMFMPFMPVIYPIIVMFLLLGFTVGMIDFGLPGMLSINTPAERQGMMLGIFRSCGSLGRATAPVTMGFLFDTDHRIPYLLGGFLLFVVAGLMCGVPGTKVTTDSAKDTVEYVKLESNNEESNSLDLEVVDNIPESCKDMENAS